MICSSSTIFSRPVRLVQKRWSIKWVVPIDQFRYIKIQSQTIDLRTRLWGINPKKSVFIPQSLVLRSIVWDWIVIYENWSIRVYRATLPFQWGVILWFQYADHSKIFVSKFHIFHTQWPDVNNSQRSIYSNMAPRRSGQNCTFSKFPLSFNIPRRDLDTKKTPPHMEVCPESLGVMLEYWYIERGLL